MKLGKYLNDKQETNYQLVRDFNFKLHKYRTLYFPLAFLYNLGLLLNKKTLNNNAENLLNNILFFQSYSLHKSLNQDSDYHIM